MNPDDPLGLIAPPKPDNDPLGLLTPVPHKLAIARREAAKPHPEDMEDAEPSYLQQAAGGVAAMSHLIPGAEAAQAGVRSFIRRQPYTEALSDIKGAEESANPWVRRFNNAAGATIAALAGPKGSFMTPLGTGGSAAMQSARIGAAEGLFSADPASIRDRILKAGKGGAIAGTIGGLLGDVAPALARVVTSKSLGAAAMQRGAQMTSADEAAYTKALAEGAGVTHPDVTAALARPSIKPYADAARASESLAGSDDATILHETFKRLGERQRGLGAQVERAADYKAGPAREIQDIELAKRHLLDAADKIMPSYKAAVQQHAKLAGEYDAFTDAGDSMNRIARGVSPAGRNLQKNTPEAFAARIARMNKEKAEAAREALLGRLQDKANDALTGNPLKLFGLPKAATRVTKGVPWLDKIDQQVTGPPPLDRVGDMNLGSSTNYLRKALAAVAGEQVSN